jgi:hypothetical protein
VQCWKEELTFNVTIVICEENPHHQRAHCGWNTRTHPRNNQRSQPTLKTRAHHSPEQCYMAKEMRTLIDQQFSFYV